MRYIIALLFGIASLSAVGQKKDSLYNINELANLTVMLYQPVTNEIGTATIIKHQNKFFLLTANHVAVQMHSSAKIVFRTGNDIPVFVDLIKFSKGHNVNWIDHPVADLSMMELYPFNDDVKARLNATNFLSELISKDQQAPPADFTYVYLGFPVIDLNLQHFSPLRFNSNVASGLITQSRKDNNQKCNFFYLDKPGVQGCSGSGVYISVSASSFLSLGKTLMCGVIHGTEGDNTGGKLAIVTPAYYIWDLLQKF